MRAQERHPVHRLDVDVTGKIFLDNTKCHDLLEFRNALDFLMQTKPEPTIEMRSDPEVRYADFLQTLAIVKQAKVERLKIRFEPLTADSKLHRAALPKLTQRIVLTFASLTYPPAELRLVAPRQGGCAAKVLDQFETLPKVD